MIRFTCPLCGADVDTGDNVCPVCGEFLDW